jgi:hypothetical protein
LFLKKDGVGLLSQNIPPRNMDTQQMKKETESIKKAIKDSGIKESVISKKSGINSNTLRMKLCMGEYASNKFLDENEIFLVKSALREIASNIMLV